MINCPVCNAPNQAGALFCEMCGNRLPSAVQAAPAPVAGGGVGSSPGASVNCPTCGHAALPGEAFCEECGTPLPAASSGAAIGAATLPSTPLPPLAQPAPQPTYPAPTPLVPSQTLQCPQCRANVLPGEAFCDSCGATLSGGQVPAAPAMPAPVAPTPSAAPTRASLSDYRLRFSDGTQLPLPDSSNIVIGREDAASNNYPDIDLTPQGALQAGVGRRHARISIQHGQLYLEDLDSTNGTILNHQKLPPHQQQPLKVGDEIRLGKFVMTLAQ